MIRIYDKLNAKGLNAYFPGQYKGLCKDKFCIVRDRSQIPDVSSRMIGRQGIDIILFIPEGSYISIKPYADDIKEALKEIGYLRKTGFETEVVIDDEKEAYTKSIEYVLQKKLEG